MRLRYLLVAASVLALVGSGLAQDCAEWNSSTFFRSATPEMVSACLEAGSDVNAQGGNGWTPLHYAAQLNSNPAIITALIEAGAEVDARDWFDSTPLHWAARSSHHSVIIEALLEAGADRAARNLSDKTPWDYARDRPVFEGTDALRRLREREEP